MSSISTYSPFLCINTDSHMLESLPRSHLLGLNFNRSCYICIGLVNEEKMTGGRCNILIFCHEF